MAWVSPSTRTTGFLVTAAVWNQDVVANAIALRSQVAAHFVLSAGMWTSTSSGCGESIKITPGPTLLVLPFAKGDSGAEVCFPLPADYDGGTITAKFFWTANSTSTGVVVWALSAVALSDNEALSTAFSAEQFVLDANGSSAYTCRISAASAALTIANTPAAGDLVCWRVRRFGTSGADTLAVTAYLASVLITYGRV
jgi:hypothetical protein